MRKGELIKLLEGLDDNVEIEISVYPYVVNTVDEDTSISDEHVWYDITGLDTSVKYANSFGQVLLTTSKEPIMT